jgi:hypothetical protein
MYVANESYRDACRQARVAIFMDINSPFLAFAMYVASESYRDACRHESRYSWISTALS